ncbi:uncharacterized protein LOC134441785 [Engraulis encrasicolus]|uniref:uncharacterized protein LOC134441785 n=1 Tax=Engraulis encrasicolus TaxID=184585 RepID=UPI002FD53A8D
MPVSCIAYNCTTKKRDNRVGFHRFPHDNPKLLKIWIAKCRWKNWEPSPNTMICTKHFEDKYVNCNGQRPRLSKGAIPTIFDFPHGVGPKKAAIDPRSRRAADRGKETGSELGERDGEEPAKDVRVADKSPTLSDTGEEDDFSPEGTEFRITSKMLKKYYADLGIKMPEKLAPVRNQWLMQQINQKLQQGTQTQDGLQTPSTSKKPGPAYRKATLVLEGQTRRAKGAEDNVLDIYPLVGDPTLFRRLIPASFFHSHYCLPQSMFWPGDAEANFEPTGEDAGSTYRNVIKVNRRWEWLALDFRGPLPDSLHRDRYIMTVSDYHSKWVEAFPVKDVVSKEVAGLVCDLCAQFGYPARILTRLTKKDTQKLNDFIRNRLSNDGVKFEGNLLVQHRQTADLDFVTECSISRMVSELMKEHPKDWNIFLPGYITRYCCKEHPTTKKSPFAQMYLKQPKPITTPRTAPEGAVEKSSFVIDLSGKSDDKDDQSAQPEAADQIHLDETTGGLPNGDAQETSPTA